MTSSDVPEAICVRRPPLLVVTLIGLASPGVYVATAYADVINVPADFRTIDAALVAAGDGDEIIVAPGTYAEAIDFLGKEIWLHSSDGPAVTTIDATGLAASVVKCMGGEGSDTVLEGFTITGGTGTVHPVRAILVGGGMYNFGSSPTVTGCIFTGNSAEAGGGMLNDSSGPIVSGCRFFENSGEGGGMLNFDSDPVVSGCVFSGNTTTTGGGGMHNEHSNPMVVNCTFIANTAGEEGGAMSGDGETSSPWVINCVLVGNSAPKGGAMYNDSLNPQVINCTFSVNSASQGGAVYAEIGSDISLVNCILWGDSAPVGEEIYLSSFGDRSTATISHSVVAGGWSGVFAEPGSSVIWSAINIDADPLFVDPAGADGRLGTEDDDLHLLRGSPCINTGTNDTPGLPAEDIDGEPRVQHSVVDMGADETSYSSPAGEENFVHFWPLAVGYSWKSTNVIDASDVEYDDVLESSPFGGYPEAFRIGHDRCNNLIAVNDGAAFILLAFESECELDDFDDADLSSFFDGYTFLEVPDGFDVLRLWENLDHDLTGIYGVDPTLTDVVVLVSYDSDHPRNDHNVILESGGGLPFIAAVTDILFLQKGVGPIVRVDIEAEDGQIGAAYGIVASFDCNGNEVADHTDIETGTSPDFDGNGIPDECDFPGLFVGADGGSWFEPTNWFLGSLPDEGTAVLIPVNVLVDQGGALAETVSFANGGSLTFVEGALAATEVTIGEGSTIGGTGVITGSVVNNGSLEPGAPIGAFTIDGDYTQGTTGRLAVDIQDVDPRSGHDTLTVTGTATLAGQLRVSMLDPFVPAVGQQFDFMTIGGRDGQFGVIFTTGLGAGQLATVNYPRGPTGTIDLTIVSLGDVIGFDPPREFTVDALPSDAVVGNFDGDADDFIDLALSVPSLDSVFVLFNEGNDLDGSWLGFDVKAVEQIIVGPAPSAIETDLVDGDGAPDLVTANAGDGTVSVLLNDGAGIFTVESSPEVGAEPSDITSGQFDGDDNTDLAVTNRGDGTVSVLLGAGDGTFPAKGISTFPVGNAPAVLEAGDFDGGALDLVVVTPGLAPEDDGLVQVFAGGGDGTFALLDSTTVDGDPLDIDPEDIDNDKDLDVVVASRFSETVSVLINDGGGVLTVVLELPMGGMPTSIVAFNMDVEAEPDSDLAVAVNDPDEGRLVRVFRNDLVDGQLAFVPDDDLGAGLEPVIVLSGDVNNDGLEDLITVNDDTAGGGSPLTGGTETTVAVLLNGAEPVSCVGDGDGDGDVGFVDLLIVLSDWGPCPPARPCPGDHDGDGVVDFVDLLLVLANWGPCEQG